MRYAARRCARRAWSMDRNFRFEHMATSMMVEPVGIEPTTNELKARYATGCVTAPIIRWCARRDLNSRPAACKTAALPD